MCADTFVTGTKGQKVEMDRGVTYKNKEPEFWVGEIKAVVFFTESVSYVRQQ